MAKYQKKNTLKEDEDMFRNLFVTFIGAGNMAQAICRRLISIKGQNGDVLINPNRVFALAGKFGTNSETFKKLGCQVHAYDYDDGTEDMFEEILEKYKNLYDPSNNLKEKEAYMLIFLCVKPHIYYQISNELSEAINKKIPMKCIVISTMAGVPLAQQPKQHVSHTHPTLILSCRIMTNLACSIGEASIAFYEERLIASAYFRSFNHNASLLLKELLTYLGQLFICEDEKQLDVVCGLCGSGLAYVFSMIQAMADGAVLSGLPRSLALDMAVQTTLGAAALCQQKNDATGFKESNHPILWRDKVTSPGGTTITGLLQLEESSFNSSVMKAIKAATEKSISFSKSFESNPKKK